MDRGTSTSLGDHLAPQSVYPDGDAPAGSSIARRSEKESERRSRKSGRESLLAYLPPPVVAPFISRFLGFPPDEQFFRDRRAVEGQILLGNVSPL